MFDNVVILEVGTNFLPFYTFRFFEDNFMNLCLKFSPPEFVMLVLKTLIYGHQFG